MGKRREGGRRRGLADKEEENANQKEIGSSEVVLTNKRPLTFLSLEGWNRLVSIIRFMNSTFFLSQDGHGEHEHASHPAGTCCIRLECDRRGGDKAYFTNRIAVNNSTDRFWSRLHSLPLGGR